MLFKRGKQSDSFPLINPNETAANIDLRKLCCLDILELDGSSMQAV